MCVMRLFFDVPYIIEPIEKYVVLNFFYILYSCYLLSSYCLEEIFIWKILSSSSILLPKNTLLTKMSSGGENVYLWTNDEML
jgi:hypothetical protein